MIWFIIGFIVGGFFGAMIMALMNARKDNDEQDII